MNPGIYYLYEYENNTRKRNVGFIKISRHYQTCILQIRVREISAGDEAVPELYAFYKNGGFMTGSKIAVLDCTGKSISVRLSVSERNFPENRPLSEIDGFLIKLPDKDSSVFWMASSAFFRADLNMLRTPEATDSVASDTPDQTPAPDNTVSISPSPDESRPDAGLKPDSTGSADSGDDVSGQEISDGQARASEKKVIRARKIQRSDIAVLPRRFWFLADNSFLLHGCRNYSHLLLAEEDGRLWLGVPGIYDPREAKAADLFGFPRFTEDYVPLLNLEPDERSEDPSFGHWCRCVGTGRIKR